MKISTIKSILVVLAIVVPLAALTGCRADTEGLETLDVAALVARLGGDSPPVVCDANNSKTRAEYGVIPGARLLSNYRDYDVAVELPADKATELIFYCHSPSCGAAADAARTAVAAGYQRVLVMPDGIRGWTKAGQAVEPAPEQGDA